MEYIVYVIKGFTPMEARYFTNVCDAARFAYSVTHESDEALCESVKSAYVSAVCKFGYTNLVQF